jgi:RNA polymerase sigma-70 factor (ECF subfamily)
MGRGPTTKVDLFRIAREAWPGLRVEEDAFLERLESLGAPAEHVADLYLALGCARRDPLAAAGLDRDYLAQVAQYIARVDPSPLFADEVRQVLRERLLLGDRPKILDYQGMGPLGAWLRVAALRVALNLKAAASRRRTPHDGTARVFHHGVPAENPERQLIKEASRRQFESALRSAISALPPDQRRVLKLHLNERLSIDKIAALHGVHRATAARWLQAARTAIFEGTRGRLRRRLRLTDSDFDRMADSVRSQIDVSLHSQLSRSAD